MAQKIKKLQVADRPKIDWFPTSPTEKDPRIQQIKDELVADWEKSNGPGIQEGKLQPQFQEFLYGNPQKKIPSLEEKTIELFRQRFPESQTTINEAVVPKIAPASRSAPLKTTRGKVSALGVLAELESIEPILRKHQQEVAPKLSQSLQQKVEEILPKIGARGLDKNQIPTIAQEIAAETARETLENVAKIQDISQINQVLADSLTQSIIAHPQIAEVKTSEGKLYEQVSNQTQDIAQANQPDLEKTAVLGAISQIAELKKPDQQALEFISDQVEQTVETQAPLTPPEERSYLTGALGTYLATYVDNFEEKLAPSLAGGQVPSFDQLQKIKDVAHNQTVAQVDVNFTKSKEGKIIDAKIGFKPLVEHISSVMGLKPLSAVKAESLGLGSAQPKALTFAKAAGTTGFGVGLILNSPPRQVEAYHSLLAYDKPRLDKSMDQLAGKIKMLKERKALTYRDRKDLLAYQRQLDNFNRARSFSIRQPKRFKTYLAYFQSLPVGKRLNWASQSAWATTEAFLGQYRGVTVPKSLAANPVILSGRTFGSLSFGLGPGNFHVGLPRPQMLGMSKSLAARASIGLLAAGIATGILGRIAKGSAAAFGALFLYMLGLGQAAATGFVIGAAIGGTIGTAIGAYLGFQIGVALAPFTFGLSIPVCTFLGGVGGGFIGGSVGGVAGGLIALGIASGSSTMVSMGVGAGIGGIIGGYVGATVGGTIGTAIGTGLAVLTGGLTTPLIPVFTIVGTTVGMAVGTVVGALAGTAIGYLFGNYVLPAFRGVFDTISASLSGTAGVSAGGILGAIGSFFTGAAATIWGGITGAGGAILGGLSAAGNFIVGGLASLTVPASMVAIPVVGGISAVAIGGTIVGIVTATSFFSAETDLPTTPGENQFVSVEKLASAPALAITPLRTIQFPYKELPQTLKFNVKIKAKANLTNVVCSEKTTLTKKDGTTERISLSPAPPCPSDFTQDQEFTFSQTVTIPQESKYQDSQVINTFSVNGTSDSTSFNVSATATVSIGNPPQCAPNAVPIKDPWKLTSDFGPGHPLGVDIADSTGRPIFSTFPCTTTVIHAGWLDPRGSDGYGYAVILQSGRYETISGHMDEITVNVGDQISPYGEIGPLGNTGLSSGPHIHYEVHVDGVIANPHDYGIPYKPLNEY